MYKLFDYKNSWVIIVKNEKIVYVVKDNPMSKWAIGETYVGSGDSLIGTSRNLEELIEIGMLYVL